MYSSSLRFVWKVKTQLHLSMACDLLPSGLLVQLSTKEACSSVEDCSQASHQKSLLDTAAESCLTFLHHETQEANMGHNSQFIASVVKLCSTSQLSNLKEQSYIGTAEQCQYRHHRQQHKAAYIRTCGACGKLLQCQPMQRLLPHEHCTCLKNTQAMAKKRKSLPQQTAGRRWYGSQTDQRRS